MEVDMKIRILTVLVAGAILTACNGEGDMMAVAVDTHGEAMSEINEAKRAHMNAVNEARTMDDVHRAEEEYRATMDAALGHMGEAMDRARENGGGCAMGGGRMMRDMTREMDEHHARIAEMSALEDAVIEEQRHQIWMDEELGYMDEDHQGMRSMMNMCGGC
jgi:hypothetical protein